MKHTEWVARVTKGESVRGIGRVAQIPFRTISDQLDRHRLSAENVIAIALGYGEHPVTALIDCGFLPPHFANEADPIAALRKVSEEALAEEVLYRMKLAGDHTVLTTPIDELLGQSANDGQDGATLDRLEVHTTGGQVEDDDSADQAR